MDRYHVFNGDADGICALHQLKLDDPAESILITGVKRDIRLLDRLQGVRESSITVLDISLDANREAVLGLLAGENTIRYFDHHHAGVVPESSFLETYIDTRPSVCTSMLVDQALKGCFRPWAVVAAFGDNLHTSAQELADSLGIEGHSLSALRELGELINYNGYGETVKDLHFPPEQLFQEIRPFADPLEFIESSDIVSCLRTGHREDFSLAKSVIPEKIPDTGLVFRLPNQPWARRVMGVFSNSIARAEPSLAHATFVADGAGNQMVSVRAPLERPYGADALCHQFSGGGRVNAAGINALPEDEIPAFLDAFRRQFAG